MNKVALGLIFNLPCGNYGKITEVFSQGFNYHTIDEEGNCIHKQLYALKNDFTKY